MMYPWVTESGVEGENWTAVSGDEIFDLPVRVVLRGALTDYAGMRAAAFDLKSL